MSTETKTPHLVGPMTLQHGQSSGYASRVAANIPNKQL